MNDQKRLTCPKCGQPMTRMVVNNPMEEGWRVSYRCLKCGKMGPLVRGGRQEETEKMAELLTESWIRRLKGEKEEQPERLRAWAEALEAYKGAGLRYEEEIARLKRMAAEDILRAARWGSPCDSCVNITKGDDCDKGNCEYCENHCVCQECNYSESFVWRGVQEEKPKARGGKLYAYPIILTEEENGAYSVLIPDFGCATCGKDEIEARLKAAECIFGRMIAMRDDNEPFPAPAEMTDGLLRESCVSVGTDPGKAFWALSMVQMEEEH